ncbi:response regulator transcription factor [Lacticaseibacillus songhuajiangensis]|jgi:DNA-binding response OmpR family regulator|uniref:response regulator transcription factor n=1 Tax=Lacticaseibacillus songhuajiangensis TaxID=1296539 RepID=UPI000F78D993|nr:response regulator transcription factor [Lacticaseibacillus songhuajiangensis]
MQKIFIVEDDAVIARTISQYLTQWGYAVQIANDLTAVDAEIRNTSPNLVLLDVRLPYFNGFHWLELLRKHSHVPVIFLTSASEDMNLVLAMNMGADDFLAKPVELPVLLAKIQGLLRRAYEYQVDGSTDGSYSSGPFTLAALDNRISSQSKPGSIDLSPTETRILRLLFANPQQVVSREAIITHLWESDAFIDQNTLAVTMTRLRQKVAPIELDDCIQTVRGQGYRLVVPTNE